MHAKLSAERWLLHMARSTSALLNWQRQLRPFLVCISLLQVCPATQRIIPGPNSHGLMHPWYRLHDNLSRNSCEMCPEESTLASRHITLSSQDTKHVKVDWVYWVCEILSVLLLVLVLVLPRNGSFRRHTMHNVESCEVSRNQHQSPTFGMVRELYLWHRDVSSSEALQIILSPHVTLWCHLRGWRKPWSTWRQRNGWYLPVNVLHRLWVKDIAELRTAFVRENDQGPFQMYTRHPKWSLTVSQLVSIHMKDLAIESRDVREEHDCVYTT